VFVSCSQFGLEKMTEIRLNGPNILVTGTPGTGKSTLCSEIAELTGLEWIDIGQVAKNDQLYSGFDSTYQCQILDEDRLLDDLEEKMSEGGKIVDYHGCDFFPERWFDIVFVMTTNNTILYDRLKNRGYTNKKLQDNIQCEIFQMILEEARESFKPAIVHQLISDTPKELEDNIDKIVQWVQLWKGEHGCIS